VISSLLWPVSRVSDLLPLTGIDVWAWSLNHPAIDWKLDAQILSSSELDRLERFRFEIDRARYAKSHANTRKILSEYTGIAPEDLEFAVSSTGKPSLAASQEPKLTFNLSHSSTVALLAVASECEIGIDVETVRPIELDVAEAHFSGSELSDLKSLHDSQWLQGFYNCWTRKEAILKAEGIGLDPPLSSFDVSLLPGLPPRLLRWLPSAQISRSWNLFHLIPTSDTVGALAFDNPPAAIRLHSFSQ
jgi:4'-phosphopantetheinyl transferase